MTATSPITRTTLFTLTALVALGPLSTDFYLPALPSIAKYFGVDETGAQATLSAYLIGFAGAILVYGPLSDRFGRRPVLAGGIVIFTFASLGCALAPTIGWLVVAALYGAYSVNKRIFFVQGVPAIAAILAVLLLK